MNIKKTIMKIARSNAGGALASFCVRRCLWLIPVKVNTRSKRCVMLRHPQPMSDMHSIVIPRKRFVDIEALLNNEGEWMEFAAFLEENVRFDEVSLCCNYGCRQEVKQVHIHVLPKEMLAERKDETTDCMELEGRKAGFSSRSNIYMNAADLCCAEYVRKVFKEAHRRYLKGFSLIWQLSHV